MAIVELDNVPSRRPRRADPALIAGLAVAIGAFALAMWATAPHPAAQLAAQPASASPGGPGAPLTTTVFSRDGSTVIAVIPPSGQIARLSPPLALPAGIVDVDLFQIPDRLTNENFVSTLRSLVNIRGRAGLASSEGPAMITWTENGLQYWMVSPTRTTDDLVKLADALR